MTGLPAWQRGYPLDDLKAVTAVLDAHDHGLVLSQHTRTSERTVAEAKAGGRLFTSPKGVAIVRVAKVRQEITDFSGRVAAVIEPGHVVVQRIAGPVGGGNGLKLAKAAATLGPTCWLHTWVEHPGDRMLLAQLSAKPACVKIRASSELIQVSWLGRPPVVFPIDPAERPGIAHTNARLGAAGDRLLAALARWEHEYTDHYSVYGKGKSWGAVSLRGYGPADDAYASEAFIIKPAEMSKGWKEDNPHMLDWVPRPTRLGHKLAPELAAFMKALGWPDLDRVRLMRLAPGGGELRRHADITDREAGVRDGMVMRFHFPLVTNPDVVFSSWGLDGKVRRASMAAGSGWYLDVRKPHTAVNGGDSERIHLVLDVRATDRLRKMILAGA